MTNLDEQKIIDDIAHLKEVAHKQFLESIKGAVDQSKELVSKADEAIRKHRSILRKIKDRKASDKS